MTKVEMLARIIAFSKDMREEAIKCGIGAKSYDKRLKHIEAQTWEVIQYTYKFYEQLWLGPFNDLLQVRFEFPAHLIKNYEMMGFYSMPEQKALNKAISEFVKAYRGYKL